MSESKLNGNEMPILDGSASPWMILFDRVGIRRQGASRRRIRVKKPVIVSEGEREARFEPSIAEECHFDVTIDYPHKVIHRGGTRIRCDLDSDTYLRQIARARTFCYVKDVEWMQRHNRARGGSLQNAVVFDDEGVINEEGLRYPTNSSVTKCWTPSATATSTARRLWGDTAASVPGTT